VKVISKNPKVVPNTQMDVVQVAYLVAYSRLAALDPSGLELTPDPVWHYPEWLARAIAAGTVVRNDKTFTVHGRGRPMAVAQGTDWLVHLQGDIAVVANAAMASNYQLNGLAP
jgi:hypothetical protein